MTKRYLSTKLMVERYNGGVSLKTLANWRSNGNGPPYTKIGGCVMYPVDELEEWEARRTMKPLVKA